MNLQDAKKISDVKLDFNEKKKIYEITTISNLIALRATQCGNFLVYTVYQDRLNKNEFITLLKYIKSHMVNKGYAVERVIFTKNDAYIFKFSWEKTIEDILEEENEIISDPV
jgi:hypothetical protein